jgi:hypothetical protein
VRVKDVPVDSPLGELVEEYFAALAARDYRVARVCMMSLLRQGNPQVAADVIRLTHEMEPPA